MQDFYIEILKPLPKWKSSKTLKTHLIVKAKQSPYVCITSFSIPDVFYTLNDALSVTAEHGQMQISYIKTLIHG